MQFESPYVVSYQIAARRFDFALRFA
jgi:hypothetical protein